MEMEKKRDAADDEGLKERKGISMRTTYSNHVF